MQAFCVSLCDILGTCVPLLRSTAFHLPPPHTQYVVLLWWRLCYFFAHVGPQVGVLLEDSPDFTAVPVAKDQDSHCLCANGRHTTSWLVTPKSLGEWELRKGTLRRNGECRKGSYVSFFSRSPQAHHLLKYRTSPRPAQRPEDALQVLGFGRCQVPGTTELSSVCVSGNVNFSVTAEARQSPEPCGSEVATVPETGRKDTVVKVLIVEVSNVPWLAVSWAWSNVDCV